ncbi:MAG: hypothetical protein RQ966_18240 [Acetobacteraceae bacterium]|jgi:hypothetical protein|nr:hypothetical protein [Acetobacteraceae bacterium]
MTVVPYYAQWESVELIDDIVRGRRTAADDPLWARSGARTRAEYEFWSWRACGTACLRMLLAARGDAVPATVPLAMELLAAGAYTLRAGGLDGLTYAPFAEHVSHCYGLTAEARPHLDPTELLALAAAGTRVIASVHPSVRDAPVDPPSRGGHLVLVYAADDDELVFHNPSGTARRTRESARLPLATFARYYANRGVVLAANCCDPRG